MKRFFPRCPAGALGALAAAIVVCLGAAFQGVAAAHSGAGGPHRGGTLTIAAGTDPPNLNVNVTSALSVTPIQRLYGNMLFQENGKGETVPSLATSYRESSNGDTYTIYLRHGVKWSDGMPFTSKDVVFTFEKFLPVAPALPSALVTDVTSVKAVGVYEVLIHLKHPYAAFLPGLQGNTFYMEPEHVYGDRTVVKDARANDQPIGTGPYIVQQWIRDQRVILVRNPHYWAATKDHPVPYFSRVVVDFITNPQTIVDDLMSGSIDYVPTASVPPTSIRSIERSSCCRAVAIHTTPAFMIMFTNTARPPFNNLTVRRAVYMAITRRLIVKDALSGFGSLPRAPIPPYFAKLYTPSINLMKQYPFDPSKAAQMLDRAGFTVKNGERFGKPVTLVYSGVSTGTFAIETAAIVKAELAKITIKVNLTSEDATAWATQTYVKRNFTLSFVSYTSANDPALGIQRAFACQPVTPTVEYTNPTGYCSKKLTSLFVRADGATSFAGRKQAYSKAQKIIDDTLPAYELAWRKTYVGVSKRVQNWKVSLLSWGGAFNSTWSESWFK